MTYSTGWKKPFATDPEALLSAWRGIPCSESTFHWTSTYQELLIPGQGSPEETSPVPQLQRDSGQGDFRDDHTTAVFPVWQPEVTTLAAEMCPTPQPPIIDVLTTTRFNLSTVNSEVHRLVEEGHIHASAFSATHTKPFAQAQSRAAGWETSGKTEVLSAANTFLGPSPRHWVQAHLLPGLWAGMVVRGTSVDHLQQKSPAQSQTSCWDCHRPY